MAAAFWQLRGIVIAAIWAGVAALRTLRAPADRPGAAGPVIVAAGQVGPAVTAMPVAALGRGSFLQ